MIDLYGHLGQVCPNGWVVVDGKCAPSAFAPTAIQCPPNYAWNAAKNECVPVLSTVPKPEIPTASAPKSDSTPLIIAGLVGLGIILLAGTS